MKLPRLIIIASLLIGFLMYLNGVVDPMNQERSFVIITKPFFIQGIGCFLRDSKIVAGICKPDESEILLEIKSNLRLSCKAKRGKWQIELTDVPNDLFQMHVKLVSHPDIIETAYMLNYLEPLLVVREIEETSSSFFTFAIEFPPVYPNEATFQVQVVETQKCHVKVIQTLTQEQVQIGRFSIDKDKLKMEENILVLVMKTAKKNIYSAPISVDNIERLSEKAIEESKRIGKLVRDFYSLECKGLSAKKAGKKIVNFLKKQKGLKNIKFQGFEISWETQEGIAMVFSLAPPDID